MRDHLVRPMRLAEKSGHARGEHAVEPFLRDEARAEQHDGFGVNLAEPAESFFAIHERHREIEQNEIKVGRTFAEKIETFKTRLGSYDFEASLADMILEADGG